MNVLLLGSTGLLGQAMARELGLRGHDVRGAARTSASLTLDITHDKDLIAALETIDPGLVVNCAAMVGLDECERDPVAAWRCNARPLSFIADWSTRENRPLIHISTDQYYSYGGDMPHDEQAPVNLLNEYARTKYAGEMLALTSPQSLVLRTSIVGIRGWRKRPTFAEWAIDVVEHDRPVTLFSDAYTSSIDVSSFTTAALNLFESGARGVFNLASREVYSKERFVRELARQMGARLRQAVAGSVNCLAVRRASCLGLDVCKAEQRLGYALPGLAQVVAAVVAQHRENVSYVV